MTKIFYFSNLSKTKSPEDKKEAPKEYRKQIATNKNSMD